MKPVPSGICYAYPIRFKDGRLSICQVPEGYVQAALSTRDLQELSQEFGLDAAAVRAVMEVASAGSGFLRHEPAPIQPKLRFEAHWFYRLTPKPVSKVRPDLASCYWNRNLYKGGSAEWPRLLDAMAFDEIQALKSASYGLGQVMGFNYTAAGCESIQQFIEEVFAGEYWQARHMLNYIANSNLLVELKHLDWAGFARGYHGPGYRNNRYDQKLAAAYGKARAAVAAA
ncbi:MAG: N-acetylmuramidase family protein [Leptolyngbyaceae cyanobacterium]